MATLLKVWNNLADIKSAGGVALGLGTQGARPERSMSDQYYSAIQEQWSNIRGLYMAYGSKKPSCCMISTRRKSTLIHIRNLKQN
jgi:hypothetical protein